ncbi:intradiol ring-cleavage dioxygenase [Flavobacterium akiainvivens]|uniref:Intradiol ring-cleavage dioxygenase n=1 Tax=Flavobacterium akiainvivens TaxID=1202724 RepID=A0A0M9VI86_9FLAO|nr:intradiol ring-cleavage dioxygenase [Flavobacterium akiainvivens]KOS06386.1 intradiol ring-cleavage dioxygenase [Flavobacterium akiainvivens]SFQ14682.1 Dioxygenase [Flavobacterium akiainvivens]
MERKQFLRTMGFAGLALTGLKALNGCSTDDESVTNTGSGSSNTPTDGSCTVSPTETAGPFPTINPASLVVSDITADRTGVALAITITVKNVNNDCNVLENAIVDIWHCDKDGNYSEYGGTQMQSTNYTSAHFLRGRQTTNADGQVAFTSIFPGWYTGRATHIHVHIYNSSGNSLLITQIAFPEGSNSAVVQVNAATAYGYTKDMNGYTYNAADNIFSDDDEGAETATISGNIPDGFSLEHTIFVAS